MSIKFKEKARDACRLTRERKGASASVLAKWKMTLTARKRPDFLYPVMEGGHYFPGKFLFVSLTQLIRLEV